jgi:branched-chain amino acid transport system permease protein
MSDFLQTFVNALSLGSLYALIALGYTLVYGVLRFINFAHSDIVTWGGWIAATVAGWLGWQATGSPVFAMPVVLVLTMAICAALGVTIEIAAYRPLRKAPRLNVLITAIGVSLLLQNVGQLDKDVGPFSVFFGTQPRPMPALLSDAPLFHLGAVPVALEDVVTVGLAAVLMLVIEWMVFHTRMGRGMRAVSHDERAAALMGVDVNRVITVTFAIGSALAAAGGLLYGLKYNQLKQTADAMWVLLGLKAFIAAVVGGIGNVRGAVVGALLIGFVEKFAGRYLPELADSPASQQVLSQLNEIVVFAILILVLLFRPSGIFGKSVVEKV